MRLKVSRVEAKPYLFASLRGQRGRVSPADVSAEDRGRVSGGIDNAGNCVPREGPLSRVCPPSAHPSSPSREKGGDFVSRRRSGFPFVGWPLENNCANLRIP